MENQVTFLSPDRQGPKVIPAIFVFILILSASCGSRNGVKESSSEHFRLITYNIWYGFTIDSGRKRVWLDWMKSHHPDVVSLQELNAYTPASLQEDAAYWGHPYTALLKTEGFPTGVTSRYPIEDVRRILEGFHHGLMRVRIHGIYYYIIHLHPSDWEVRIREIKNILDDVRTLEPGSPVILAGDFNTLSGVDSVYYSTENLVPFFQKLDVDNNSNNLDGLRLDYTVPDLLREAGFTDTEYMFREDDYQFTGSFPTRIDKSGDDGDPRRLDYVFVNELVKNAVTGSRIIVNDTTSVLSDHYPLIVDFRME